MPLLGAVYISQLFCHIAKIGEKCSYINLNFDLNDINLNLRIWINRFGVCVWVNDLVRVRVSDITSQTWIFKRKCNLLLRINLNTSVSLHSMEMTFPLLMFHCCAKRRSLWIWLHLILEVLYTFEIRVITIAWVKLFFFSSREYEIGFDCCLLIIHDIAKWNCTVIFLCIEFVFYLSWAWHKSGMCVKHAQTFDVYVNMRMIDACKYLCEHCWNYLVQLFLFCL